MKQKENVAELFGPFLVLYFSEHFAYIVTQDLFNAHKDLFKKRSKFAEGPFRT